MKALTNALEIIWGLILCFFGALVVLTPIMVVVSIVDFISELF